MKLTFLIAKSAHQSKLGNFLGFNQVKTIKIIEAGKAIFRRFCRIFCETPYEVDRGANVSDIFAFEVLLIPQVRELLTIRKRKLTTKIILHALLNS